MIYKPITPAQLVWHNSDQPYSPQFEDIYFSKENAFAETDYVFIQQNQLIKRWQQWNISKPFVILETGFGTGLNFLATWVSYS